MQFFFFCGSYIERTYFSLQGEKSEGSSVFYPVLQDHRMSELKGALDIFVCLLKPLLPPLPSPFSANDLVSHFLQKTEVIRRDHPQVPSTMCSHLPGDSVPLDLSFSPVIMNEPLCYWLRIASRLLVYTIDSTLFACSKTRA